MLRTIHLHGALGQAFGREFRLDVATPAEAVRALGAQLKGFREAIAGGEWRVVRGAQRQVAKGHAIDAGGLQLRLGQATHLHILPAARGRGGGRGVGTGKIILGVVLLAAAVVTGGMAAAAYAGSVGLTGATASTGAMISAGIGASVVGVPGLLSAGTVGLLGLSMIAGGVSTLLSPQRKTQPGQGATEENPSFTLAGPMNSGAEGLPVPLVFGKVRVGSVVAAGAIRNFEYGASLPTVSAKDGVAAAYTT